MDNIYNYLIIGGGIAGLYFYYKVSKNISKNIDKNIGKKIILLEASDRFGGRISTNKVNLNNTEVIYNNGASVFKTSHKLLLKLLIELNLEKNIRKISETNKYIGFKTDKVLYNIESENVINNEKKEKDINIIKTIEDLKTKINFDDKKIYNELISMNLMKIIEKYMGKEKSTDMKNEYIYNDVLMLCNAIDGIRYIDDEAKPNNSTYSLRDGMEQIIDALKKCNLKEGDLSAHMKIDSDVVYINFNNNDNTFNVGTKNGGIYTCENLILACPKKAIKDISMNGFTPEQEHHLYSLLESVNATPLIRVNCTFPKNKQGKIWFDELDKFSTNPPIKYFIPLDKENGFVMICYTDTINAEIIWSKYKRNELKDYLQNYFRKLFPNLDIPDIGNMYIYYCNDGAHYWAPNYMGKKYYEKILKPFEDHNMYIIGESYSMNQAWIEGALESTEDVLKLLKIDDKTQ